MTIQYCSDLHLEFKENLKWLSKNPIKPVGEVLIIAGDTIYLQEKYFNLSFFDWLADNFQVVYLIPGNHEYYGGFDIAESYPFLNIQIRSNVYMVNNFSIEFENCKLIFSTLWSNLKKNVEFIYMTMADFHFNIYEGKSFLTEHYNTLHKLSLQYIDNELNNSKKKNVVVTHHLPSLACYNTPIKDTFLIDAYCTDLSQFILHHSIDFWIYGHCHWNQKETTIGKTKLVTNQLGYVYQGEHHSFSLDKIIQI